LYFVYGDVGLNLAVGYFAGIDSGLIPRNKGNPILGV
jgi:hypothetical protein